MANGSHVIVVGAGIIGASIAWHLTKAQARVTLIEAKSPGGVATPNSFAWINSNYHFSESYFRLRHHSMGAWRRLTGQLPHLPVSISGSIYLPAPKIDLEEFVARNAAWGYRIALINGARVRELEPNLALETDIAAHALDEGAAEAEDVARLLAEAAVDAGAELLMETKVDGLRLADGDVSGVRTSDAEIACDEVVVASGTATPDLVAATGFTVPLATPPGLLAHTKPVRKLLNGLVLADGLHMRQKANGQLLAGSDYQGSALADDPESGGAELVRRLREALDANENIVLDRTTTGTRPMPEDGVPIVGRAPGVTGLYIAVMHSGVTLCPAIGDFVAREILDGVRHPLLEPFGPERFEQTAPTLAQA
jgi:glycine/D-amino acid oxidase-like deaminating enzyme